MLADSNQSKSRARDLPASIICFLNPASLRTPTVEAHKAVGSPTGKVSVIHSARHGDAVSDPPRFAFLPHIDTAPSSRANDRR